jgi:hypothetical protein
MKRFIAFVVVAGAFTLIGFGMGHGVPDEFFYDYKYIGEISDKECQGLFGTPRDSSMFNSILEMCSNAKYRDAVLDGWRTVPNQPYKAYLQRSKFGAPGRATR